MSWLQVKIGSFLKRIKRPVKVYANSEYKLVTIRINHNGVSLRETKRGSDLKSNMYEVKEGDFILSGIDARNGAFGIIPKELDGALVTNDFWYFDIDESVIDKHFFLELTSTIWFDEICKRGSDGTTQRIRLQKDKFFNQIITLPNTMTLQKELLSRITNVKARQIELSNEIRLQNDYLAKLKQSILQDAISGKLTEQWRAENPDIEPASELLKRIKAEKEQMINEGKIRKDKPLEPITDSELPFEIPATWQWCRLGDLCVFINGIAHEQHVADNGKYIIVNSKFISTNATVKKYSDLQLLPVTKDDILIVMSDVPNGRALARCFKVDANNRYTLNQRIGCLRFNDYIHIDYLMYLLDRHPYLLSFNDGKKQTNLKKESILKTPLCIPPYKEQKRIVDIIKESLEKCSLIEAQITANELIAQNLLKSILSETFNNN